MLFLLFMSFESPKAFVLLSTLRNTQIKFTSDRNKKFIPSPIKSNIENLLTGSLDFCYTLSAATFVTMLVY